MAKKKKTYNPKKLNYHSKDFMEAFYVRLRICHAFKGWTYTKTAERAGLTGTTISRLVNCKNKNIFVSTLLGIAKAYNVSPLWLVGAKDNPKWKTNQKSYMRNRLLDMLGG